jgi:hypothetical protein
LPALLFFIFAVLVGYPLIQLCSVILVRSGRQELAVLIKEIKSDTSYDSNDLQVLEWAVLDKPPSAITAFVFPIYAPIATLIWSWEILRGRLDPTADSLEKDTEREYRVVSELVHEGSSKSKIWNDPRFHRARFLSTEIEIKRMPITMLVSAVMASLMLPFVFLAYGIRTSVTSFFTHLFKRALFANKLLFAGLEVHRVAIAKISLPQR